MTEPPRKRAKFFVDLPVINLHSNYVVSKAWPNAKHGDVIAGLEVVREASREHNRSPRDVYVLRHAKVTALGGDYEIFALKSVVRARYPQLPDPLVEDPEEDGLASDQQQTPPQNNGGYDTEATIREHPPPAHPQQPPPEPQNDHPSHATAIDPAQVLQATAQQVIDQMARIPPAPPQPQPQPHNLQTAEDTGASSTASEQDELRMLRGLVRQQQHMILGAGMQFQQLQRELGKLREQQAGNIPGTHRLSGAVRSVASAVPPLHRAEDDEYHVPSLGVFSHGVNEADVIDDNVEELNGVTDEDDDNGDEVGDDELPTFAEGEPEEQHGYEYAPACTQINTCPRRSSRAKNFRPAMKGLMFQINDTPVTAFRLFHAMFPTEFLEAIVINSPTSRVCMALPRGSPSPAGSARTSPTAGGADCSRYPRDACLGAGRTLARRCW